MSAPADQNVALRSSVAVEPRTTATLPLPIAAQDGTRGTPILAARGIGVRFGGIAALSDVDLEVARRGITGLIGPNGAGKTTLFNVLTGLQAPASGHVFFDGSDITGRPPHWRGRAGIARTFQLLELFSRMTVHENLLGAWEAARPWGVLGRGRRSARREVDHVIEVLALGAVARRPAGELPTGVGRVVELGRAMCARPRVLLLDEPGSGLDRGETERLVGVLRRLTEAEDTPAVLLVEHDMRLVMLLCATVVVLDFGRRIAGGTPREIRDDPVVQAAYLGRAEAGGGAPGGGTGEADAAEALP